MSKAFVQCIVLLEIKILESDIVFGACGQYGDDSRKLIGVGSGHELRHKIGGEAHASIIVYTHLAIYAFGCLCASFECHVSGGQKEHVDFALFLDNFRTGGIDIFDETDVDLDEKALATSARFSNMFDNLIGLFFVPIYGVSFMDRIRFVRRGSVFTFQAGILEALLFACRVLSKCFHRCHWCPQLKKNASGLTRAVGYADTR